MYRAIGIPDDDGSTAQSAYKVPNHKRGIVFKIIRALYSRRVGREGRQNFMKLAFYDRFLKLGPAQLRRYGGVS